MEDHITIPHTPFPWVVASVDSRKAWEKAQTAEAQEFDLLELRLDLLHPVVLMPEELEHCPHPILITARAPSEGGNPAMNEQTRFALLKKYQAQANWIDLELKTCQARPERVKDFQAAGLIVSYHDFHGTPKKDEFKSLLEQALEFQPDIIKIACKTPHETEVELLLEILAGWKTLRPSLALMGMGACGRSSRLRLAKAGSALNYGYIETPLVDGQWPAGELRRAIHE
ncbi:MAG: type I 3-dehydroquinate dehydratase [Verrucomicrobiales bacterium]